MTGELLNCQYQKTARPFGILREEATPTERIVMTGPAPGVQKNFTP